MKHKTIKLLKGNIAKYLCDLWENKILKCKTITIIEKMGKLDL